MAKGRPTYKTIRQGQTVYFINRHFERGANAKPELDAYFLHSHKVPLPPACCVITKMPVDFLREYLKKNQDICFFSRKKATRKMREL